MNLAFKAMMFAREIHSNQRRKFTGNPYADHLAEVAGIVATVSFDAEAVEPEHAIAVAWLHDSMEDQAVSQETIRNEFGPMVLYGVQALSDLEEGARSERKAASRVRLAAALPWVQTIKCADLISNTGSIVEHDPNFAAIYLEEKRMLLDVLTQADPRLMSVARNLVERGQKIIQGMGDAGAPQRAPHEQP
ncbi:MAG: bifunctional (p)ppGpp synthetase/guanosine-3',5'-bis(diphosphate) 3'-pyrophosphohydrolase [Burkholderiaceae bacterium]|nr:MAG: bifunctional (p)ppGpp synthetase/guanosine-3',5'-bis(diphosphate) 3'-pyrophosphohydrolase [Burkholderiaceae bacterium]TBR76764.1 MAG: bifunctional (p)ppGpp synthetase/guanosine-3',5'-bis(diphosphate) 3'-pyrophosphohydrolase [Burkholderiaceae bacterium]